MYNHRIDHSILLSEQLNISLDAIAPLALYRGEVRVHICTYFSNQSKSFIQLIVQVIGSFVNTRMTSKDGWVGQVCLDDSDPNMESKLHFAETLRYFRRFSFCRVGISKSWNWGPVFIV